MAQSGSFVVKCFNREGTWCRKEGRMNFDLFGDLELIEVKPTVHGGGHKCNKVTIGSKKNVITISKGLMEDLPWADTERVNLYACGNMFVFKKHKVGLVKVKRTKNGGGRITGMNVCLEILSRCKGNRHFEGEVQEDAIFFKPIAKGEI